MKKKLKHDPRPPRGLRECVWCGKVHDTVLHTQNPMCSNACKMAERYARKKGTQIRCKCGYSVAKSETYYGKCLECRSESS